MTTRRDARTARTARRYASAAIKAFGAAAVLVDTDPATRATLAQYLS